MRRVRSTPSVGIQGRLSLITPEAATSGVSHSVRARQARALPPASQAPARRAVAGSSEAHRLPANGIARIRVRSMEWMIRESESLSREGCSGQKAGARNAAGWIDPEVLNDTRRQPLDLSQVGLAYFAGHYVEM